MRLPKFTLGKKDLKKELVDQKPKAEEEKVAAAQDMAKGMINIKDILAPAAVEVDFNHIRIGPKYYTTLFISGYPRFVGANWLSPIINFDHTLDLSMFYYPVKSKGILEDLKKKITEMEATVRTDRERGKIEDPTVTSALEDAHTLQEQLVKGIERFFQFSFYITIPADTLEELKSITSKVESTLGSLLLISKTASLQMEQAFQSTIPTALDKLLITRNMDTTSLATTFPFTSSDLTMETGIMYGINRHNGSLIIFDRFSMENANTVVFAKSGSGKSYFVKLEALRSLVFGAEVIIIDVEEEYKMLCEAVGGDFISFSSNSKSRINPFDLSNIAVEGENELGQKILSLHTLLKLIFKTMTSTEEAILDRALIETYRIKGITPDPETQMTKEPPVMEDLYKVLLGADEPEAKGMAERLERYIKGSLTGIFDSQSNVNLNSKMTVFSTKNLEDILRPIAFYIILDFIWTKIRRDLKKRILVVEEAWYLMQNEDSARFIYGIAKRARKYYLGLTTVSQDVDDFLTSEYGKAIVTNSSIQVLLKQHPAAIDKVADTFYLSEGEKRLLLGAGQGEGLFFAGSNHVSIRVVASEAEHNLITTNPAELLKLRERGLISGKAIVDDAAKLRTPQGPQNQPGAADQPQQKPIYRPIGPSAPLI
jgi:type IV secretory pathway VirB4 component